MCDEVVDVMMFVLNGDALWHLLNLECLDVDTGNVDLVFLGKKTTLAVDSNGLF